MNVSGLTIEITSFTGSRQIINNFSADFNNGINVIFGPPASGKTTLLQTLAGLNRPVSGEIKRNNCLSFVSQVPEREFIHSSCAGELGVERPEDFENIENELKEIGLDKSVMKRSPWSLSRGEKKRIALLRAIREYNSCEKIVILDDPFCDLDNTGRDQAVRMLKKCSANVVIMSTNRQEDLDFLEESGLKYNLMEL